MLTFFERKVSKDAFREGKRETSRLHKKREPFSKKNGSHFLFDYLLKKGSASSTKFKINSAVQPQRMG